MRRMKVEGGERKRSGRTGEKEMASETRETSFSNFCMIKPQNHADSEY